jgi:hypothetical protein
MAIRLNHRIDGMAMSVPRRASGDYTGLASGEEPGSFYAVAMSDTLPTPRTTLHCRYVRVLLTCWSCKHQRDADLADLIAAGLGDTPLVHLRWRCAKCGGRRIDMVCTSHARVAR